LHRRRAGEAAPVHEEGGGPGDAEGAALTHVLLHRIAEPAGVEALRERRPLEADAVRVAQEILPLEVGLSHEEEVVILPEAAARARAARGERGGGGPRGGREGEKPKTEPHA